MSDKLMPCRCGNPGSTHETDDGRWSRLCVRCGAQTPFYDTTAESDASWNRMQSPETFTRADCLELIDYVIGISGSSIKGVGLKEMILKNFLAQRGK